MSNSYKDGQYKLAHMFQGKALPDHLAREKATGSDSGLQAEGKAYRDGVSREIAAKMDKSPLIAINFKHVCTCCGNKWIAFGFFARTVKKERMVGEGSAFFTKPLNYRPQNERVTAVEWQERFESACINCYGGPDSPDSDLERSSMVSSASSRIGVNSSLTELVQMAHLGTATDSRIESNETRWHDVFGKEHKEENE